MVGKILKRSSLVSVVSVVTSVAVLAAGVAHHLQRRDDQDDRPPSAVAALVPNPFVVTMTPFVVQREVVIGSAPMVTVSALGDAITSLELFDGDRLVARERFDPPMTLSASSSFAWPIALPGTHVLYARAVGVSPDLVAVSAPRRFEALVGVGPPEEITLRPSGLSLNEAAASVGVDASVVAVATPGSDGGQPVLLDVADPAAPLPATATVTVPAEALPLTANQSAVPAASEGAEPLIIAELDGCSARIAVTGADTVSIYETGGAGPGFTFVGSSSSELSLGPLTPGPHVFIAGLGAGAATSAPVMVEAPAECGAEIWTGSATLFDGLLTLEQPVPRLWVYIAADDLPYQRVPAVGTVAAPNGVADLNGLMSVADADSLRLEVWQAGAKPADNARLVAASTADLSAASQVVDLVGEPLGLSLTGPAALDLTAAELAFHWEAHSTRVDAVIWQVLSQPPWQHDQLVSPPTLLATGVSANGDTSGGVGTVMLDGSPSGSFVIPRSALLARSESQSQGQIKVLAPPTFDLSSLRDVGAPALAQPLLDLASVIDSDAPMLMPPVGDVFVRVLPLTASSVIGDASNVLGVALPESTEPPTAGFTTSQISLEPGHTGNYELSACVRVTEVPWVLNPSTNRLELPGQFGSPDFVSAFYPVPGTYCPVDYPSEGCGVWCNFKKTAGVAFGDILSGLAFVWDYVAAAYNGLIDLAVEIAARFNPLCLQAAALSAGLDATLGTETGEAGDVCTKVARVATKAVVSAVLASFGLPPSLPTSAELQLIAEGNIEALAVELLNQIGVPCADLTLDPAATQAAAATGALPSGVDPNAGVDVCASMVSAALGEAKILVAQALQQQISAQTGLPTPSHPVEGFSMMLEPRAQFSGATVTVVADPIDPNTPSNAICALRTKTTTSATFVDSTNFRQQVDLTQGAGFISKNWILPYSASMRLTTIDPFFEGSTYLVEVLSDGCLSGATSMVGVVGPPLGKWSPGEAN